MDTTSPIDGHCDDGFDLVREAFLSNFEDGGDVGASVAIAIDGKLVVDLWGGHLDAAATAPWQRDTLVNVFSTTKTMSCLALLVCASRGLVDLDAPVARHWPGFEANGKDGVLVRHLLSHTAGLSGWQERISTEDLYDWEKCTSLLAAQAPWWEPGTRSGYHALTQGYLVGEVVRRVTGVSVGTFFRTEIAEPTGADFHIGLPAEHDARVAPLIPAPPLATELESSGGAAGPNRESIAYRTMVNPRLDAPASFTIPWRRAEIPAAGGQGNARSVCLAQHAVACGGTMNGVELLSPEVCERIFDVQAAGRDLVMGIGVTFGVGYGLSSPKAPISPNARVCYWGGWGGSLVVNDVDARLTMGYVMNRMGEGTTGDDRAHRILRAAYRSIGQEPPAPLTR
ncbi:MAG: beta-lactamase family protein [Acidimicrobiales bacterium]|nr:beta-lactamase family protein [Acidimicrobiales bacterium]